MVDMSLLLNVLIYSLLSLSLFSNLLQVLTAEVTCSAYYQNNHWNNGDLFVRGDICQNLKTGKNFKSGLNNEKIVSAKPDCYIASSFSIRMRALIG